jgi:hypothetical protein
MLVTDQYIVVKFCREKSDKLDVFSPHVSTYTLRLNRSKYDLLSNIEQIMC